jgi:DNA-binding IscR family transcriptional regulator
LEKNGGYFLMKNPKEVRLLEIVRLFEGSVAMLKCTFEKYYEPCEHCKDEENCPFRITFKDIREYTFNKPVATSLDMLI